MYFRHWLWKNDLNEYGLKLNLEKSAIMFVSRRLEIVTAIENVSLNQVEQVKHLGVGYDQKAKQEDMEERIAVSIQ